LTHPRLQAGGRDGARSRRAVRGGRRARGAQARGRGLQRRSAEREARSRSDPNASHRLPLGERRGARCWARVRADRARGRGDRARHRDPHRPHDQLRRSLRGRHLAHRRRELLAADPRSSPRLQSARALALRRRRQRSGERATAWPHLLPRPRRRRVADGQQHLPTRQGPGLDRQLPGPQPVLPRRATGHRRLRHATPGAPRAAQLADRRRHHAPPVGALDGVGPAVPDRRPRRAAPARLRQHPVSAPRQRAPAGRERHLRVAGSRPGERGHHGPRGRRPQRLHRGPPRGGPRGPSDPVSGRRRSWRQARDRCTLAP
jgi:hypothetical protein